MSNQGTTTMIGETELHYCYEWNDSQDQLLSIRMIDCDGNEVRLLRGLSFGMDPELFSYASKREDESEFTIAPTQAPLSTLWHHAMVFFGIIPPDDISHTPA